MILFALNRTLCLLGPSQIALVGDIIIVDNRWCTSFGSMCIDGASTFSGLFSVAGPLHLTHLLWYIERTVAVYSHLHFASPNSQFCPNSWRKSFLSYIKVYLPSGADLHPISLSLASHKSRTM